MKPKIIKKIGTDKLWLGVILAGFLFYVSLIPLPPNDFWWHLKIGEIIYIHRYIPTTNMFAWTIPENYPFFYASWFGELLFYILYRIGDLGSIIFMRTLLAGITFTLVGYLSKEKSNSWRISAFTTAIACIMSMNNLPVRTQMWSWVPFILFLIILNYFTDKSQNAKVLIFLPLIMLFWVNVHGTFILGFILLGIYIIGEIIQKLINNSKALSWKNILHLTLISIATSLTILVNPRFSDIFSYVISILTNQPIQSFIEEWLPPSPEGIANTTFFLSILGMLIIFIFSTYKPRISEIMLIIAFLWLALNGQRSVIWYAIVSMPILARSIATLPLKIPPLTNQYNYSNFLILLIIFIPVLFVQPWLIKNIPLPDSYWQQTTSDSSEIPLLAHNTPVGAVRYLKEHPGGKLFNEMGYGSYMIWEIPDQSDFIDPRIELFPTELWEDYIRISHGVKLEEMINKYKINRIMLDRNTQEILSYELSKDELWILEYEDQVSQIWRVKNNLINQE